MHEPIRLALVQHGNQYLITNGYAEREGLAEILQGFAAIFKLHLKYRVPLNLHLSGTLIEAIAWHDPDFFQWIVALRQQGLLEWIGSAYAQNILPHFSFAHNLRQLNTALDVYQRHLGISPYEVETFWVPERVWHTSKLAPLMQSAHLRNGGYTSVLLDDRLAFSLNGDELGERTQFDLRFNGDYYAAPSRPEPPSQSLACERDACRPFQIAGTQDLIALPIMRALRYGVPPCHDAHWQMLEQIFAAERAPAPDELYVCADDLEKAARVGAWGRRPWTPDQIEPYEKFLAWLSAHAHVKPTLISDWLSTHQPGMTKTVEHGTYYELAHTMGAGEDYLYWWHSPQWAPYRALLMQAECELAQADSVAASPLWELAWKQLMACSYETAWHDCDLSGRRAPAPWAKALASHARAVFVIAAAARWMSQRDGQSHVRLIDLDRDGDDEVVICNDSLYAVLTPRYGGRLVYLFDLTGVGRLVVGNPADDWNWQEELNRFMDVPRNHPGAFADVDHENDRYRVQRVEWHEGTANVRLENQQVHSALHGAVKSFTLTPCGSGLQCAYTLPSKAIRLHIEFCLSPDYFALLCEGRAALAALISTNARGWRNGDTSVHVSKSAAPLLIWERPSSLECGHGLMLRVTAHSPCFEIRVGVSEEIEPAASLAEA